MLYIYFDVPSNVYQDRIISAMSFAVAVLLYGCHRTVVFFPGMVPYAVTAGVGVTLLLAANNYFMDSAARTNPIYWIEIFLVAVYVSALGVTGRRLAGKG